LSQREEEQNHSRKALIQVRGVNLMCIIFCMYFRAILDYMDFENWTLVETCRVSGNFQKLPRGVEGPPGGSCL